MPPVIELHVSVWEFLISSTLLTGMVSWVYDKRRSAKSAWKKKCRRRRGFFNQGWVSAVIRSISKPRSAQWHLICHKYVFPVKRLWLELLVNYLPILAFGVIACRKECLQFSPYIKRSHKLNVLHKNLLSNTGFPRRHNSSISPGRNISIRYILNDGYVTVHQSYSFNIPHLPHALVTTSPRALQRRYWALTMGRWGLKSCEYIGETHLDIRLL